MTDLAIRRASSVDLRSLAPLFDDYRAFYRCEPEPDRVRAFLGDRLRNGDSVIFIAKLAGRDVGFTQLYPTFASLSIGRALILNDLFVDPTARGRGIGRALLEQAMNFGRAIGARSLELSTEVTNEVGQRLYERAGWVRDTAFYHYSFTVR